jgi:hypothetical protein
MDRCLVNPGRRLRATFLVAGLTVVMLAAAPGTASAQFWKQLGFGLDIGLTEPTDRDVDSSMVVGGRGGMAPDEGWGLAMGLGWFEADLIDGRGAESRRAGELKVRPLMAGVGYTWLHGRLATTAALTAGVSVNGAELDAALQRAADAGQGFALDVGNSFAIRPSLEVEYFLARKFALSGTVGFLFTRPEISWTTPEGRFTDQWNASSFNVLAGFVLYPFR